MKYYGGLPDQQHVPYKIIAHNPHVKDIAANLRLSDLSILFGNTLFWTLGYVALERYKPTVNPKFIVKHLVIMTPFFLVVGCSMASMRVHQRFWGLKENNREVKKWQEQGREFNAQEGEWMVNDW